MATWAEIKTEIKNELDLNEEVFTSDDELLAIANEGIEDIELEIHTVTEGKYFEAEMLVPLVGGVSEYDLPEDIFAFKVRCLLYNDEAEDYEVHPLRDLKLINVIEENDLYRYRIINPSTGSKLKLYPASRVTSSQVLTLYYLRNALKMVDDTDELDIPEAKSFIKQYVLDKVINKERMTPDAPESAALARKRKSLLDSLAVMRADENNEIPPDHSHYFDHVGACDSVE